jgi:pimeloyl-ACP methyl ester carboxylesterase
MSDPSPRRTLFVAFVPYFAALAFLTMTACRRAASWSDKSGHKSGFITANGIRLHYLDWGGSGPALILIHGYQENPHIFDDLAPAFTDRFRVVAYARRGHGQSEAKGPYDTATLTEDLRGLMDGLGIAKADLAGWSMGGNEVTAMAGTHPERVGRIVYLDAAYDWSDPAFAAAFKDLPPSYRNLPGGAMASLDAWRAFEHAIWFPAMSDISQLEAYIRGTVVIQPDGTVRAAMSDSVSQDLAPALFTDRRDYTKVRCPALAIYAGTLLDVSHGDPAQAAANLAWEQRYMAPFRSAAIEQVRRELSNVEIVKVPGTHMDFLFTSRVQVVAAMRRFLSRNEKSL